MLTFAESDVINFINVDVDEWRITFLAFNTFSKSFDGVCGPFCQFEIDLESGKQRDGLHMIAACCGFIIAAFSSDHEDWVNHSLVGAVHTMMRYQVGKFYVRTTV